MADLSLSFALEHYDRHVPWVEGTVKPKGIEPTVMIIGQDGQGGRRHERMLLYREFDVCELSLGSYVMAKARGAALTAIPVFPSATVQPVADVRQHAGRYPWPAGSDR